MILGLTPQELRERDRARRTRNCCAAIVATLAVGWVVLAVIEALQ